MSDFLSVEIQSGKSITYEGHKLTPFAQTIKLQFPGINGGLIWNRPVAVLAEYDNGTREVIPITDVTRKAQFRLIGAGMVIVLTSWLIRLIVRNNSSEVSNE